MPSLEFVTGVADRLDQFAQYLFGRQGSTRGHLLEKYLVPRIAGAAEALSLSGEPKLIFPVWVGLLPAPHIGDIVSVPKPVDGVLAYWAGSDTTFLAYAERRSAEVVGLRLGSFQARPVDFQKKRKVGLGMVATDDTFHVAIGLRNMWPVPPSAADRSRPYFVEIAQLLSGAS